MHATPALLLSACLLAGCASARTFHVDASGGDDTADGLSPEHAWRTLAQVNAAPLAPGDRVLFRRGDLWRGTLTPRSGDATGVVTYGAYGPPDAGKPRLYGSLSASRAEDWVAAGPELWATAPPRFEPVGAPRSLTNVSWDLHQEAGAAAQLSTADGGLRIACAQPGTAGNHLQLVTLGLSVRAGEFYVLTLRARASAPVRLGQVVLHAPGPPWTRYAATMAGPLAVGTEWADVTVRFQSVRNADDGRLTLYLGGALPAGTTLWLQDLKLQRATCSQAQPLSLDVGQVVCDGGAAWGVKRWRAEDLQHDLDYWYDGAHQQVLLRSPTHPATRWRSVELALTRHIIDQGGKGWLTYEGLDLRYGAAHGIGGGSTQHITVRDCDLSWLGGGLQFVHPNGRPVRFGNGIEFWASAHDNLVEGCRLWEIYDAALTNQGDGVNVQENLTYRHNVIWNSEYSFEFWNRGPQSHTRNIVFEHNTCVDAGYGWSHTQRPDPNGRHLMFYDNTAVTEQVVLRANVFSRAVDSLWRVTGDTAWTRALTLSDNVWWQPDGVWLLVGGRKVAAGEFAEFLRQHKLEEAPVTAEPKFVDAGKRDYRLSAGTAGAQLMRR